MNWDKTLKWLKGKTVRIGKVKNFKNKQNFLKLLAECLGSQSNSKIVPVKTVKNGYRFEEIDQNNQYVYYTYEDLAQLGIDEKNLPANANGIRFIWAGDKNQNWVGILKNIKIKNIKDILYPDQSSLDTDISAIVLKEYVKQKHKADIEIFRNGIVLTDGNTTYIVPKPQLQFGNKILFRNLQEAAEHYSKVDENVDYDVITRKPIDFAIQQGVFNQAIIIEGLANQGTQFIRSIQKRKKEVLKYIRERVDKLSQPSSTDLTLEWLIWATLWEYIETYTNPRHVRIEANYIYYESNDKIIVPTSYRPNIDDVDIDAVELYLIGSRHLYNQQSGIQNLGWNNNGLALKISQQWNGGHINDKVDINGQIYDLEINNNGEIRVINFTGNATGRINGVDVNIVGGIVSMKNQPIPLKIYAKVEYKSHTAFKETIIKFFSDILKQQTNLQQKISDIIAKILSQQRQNNDPLVWGPPATGKTTYLACKIIDYLNRGKYVIALTPTNKAADVLTERIINIGNYNAYRFPNTRSQLVQNNNKVLTRNNPPPNRPYALIMTIHRFLFDSLNRKRIREMDWDVVIIDEASMVELPYIYYVLEGYVENIYHEDEGYFEKRNKNIEVIIAGDPKQLTPVGITPGEAKANIKGYSTENIYTVLGINLPQNLQPSPITINNRTFNIIRHTYQQRFNKRFNIIILTEQHRSVPDIGRMYSLYQYNGILRHARQPVGINIQITINNQTININSPINVIEFNINNRRQIPQDPYDIGKLEHSSYHIASAILAIEIAGEIERHYQNYKIGIISPYKAQVEIMKSLAGPYGFNLLNTTVDTVHGFQGDERDIIILVMNPPSTSPKPYSHFNNARIVNVGISRARDVLIILKPSNVYGQIEIDQALRYAQNINTITTIPSISSRVDIFRHLDVNIYSLPQLQGLTLTKDYTFLIAEDTMDIILR